ncbi:MAG: hypothetical protein R3E01_19775 [Pirellulaceae bacterium]
MINFLKFLPILATIPFVVGAATDLFGQQLTRNQRWMTLCVFTWLPVKICIMKRVFSWQLESLYPVYGVCFAIMMALYFFYLIAEKVDEVVERRRQIAAAIRPHVYIVSQNECHLSA